MSHVKHVVKKSSKSKSSKGALAPRKSAPAKTAEKRRGALGGRGARTIAIENFIAAAKRPVTVRQIEDALSEVRAIRNHVSTLYGKQLLARDDAGAYFIRKSKGAKSAK